jgi:hypothetical protein
MPPAPPGELPPEEVRKTRAVAEILERLGRDTEPGIVAKHIKQMGLDIKPDEVIAIRTELLRQATTPPGPDQPPPQEARRKPMTGVEDKGPRPGTESSPLQAGQQTG